MRVVELARNPAKPAAPRLLSGVDVSSFQGRPGSWVEAAGSIAWAAVKISELLPPSYDYPRVTRYVNPDAAADWEWLGTRQKGRIAYFFAHPSLSAADNVDLFIAELTPLGLLDTDAVAIDLEVTDGLGAAEVAAWGVAALSELERKLWRTPLLYTFLGFAAAGNCAGQERYPLWIADPSRPAGHPQVPAPWHAWTIHQYDISGVIDRDVARYPSEEAMFSALGVAPVAAPAMAGSMTETEEPDVQNLGGNLVSALASGRWPDGQMVVAGLGQDGYIQANIWNGSAWVGWQTVSPTRARSGPSVTVWVNGYGRMFYIDESNDVIQLDTADRGLTWT
jgi:lysozyme